MMSISFLRYNRVCYFPSVPPCRFVFCFVVHSSISSANGVRSKVSTLEQA
jgi:hypothetical protein